ncbi:hypothetical protein LOD99_3669 [Oopsacas minuta]|uniref:Ion transport domain-containing protein n=1 Tax=Oopsacas minuta TaxID=111878 RepID=A0AAV7JY54_9METZ|nr:hypothetical protein LOD99_3669 [Oopsacas minuta]
MLRTGIVFIFPIFSALLFFHISYRLGELKESLLLQNENKKIPVLLPNDRAVVDLILKYSQLDSIVDKEIGSLIHKAAAEDNVLLANALVEKNIELQVVNSKGFSPLKIASKRGNIGVVKVLLNAGADPNYIGKKVPGFSALNNAVQFGQLACAKLLIDFGANLVHSDMTNTALHSASYGGHPDVVEFLIRDVGMDVNQRNNANRTPLYQSITQGHYSVAKVLLGLGADPNVALTAENETLVHIAVREGEKEILTLLLEAKARPDEALRNGTTPLMLAVQADRADYIPLIMAYGITLAKKDQEGETILHHIARNDSCDSAKYILKRIGAMKGITQEFQIFKNKNEHGKSAYDIAIECHSERVLKIFIRHSPKNYFRNNTQQIHRFYDKKLYDTLKEILSGLVSFDEENGRVTAEVIIFESSEDGNFPDKQSEYPIKQTLLHKLKDCPDPELKYHPLVNLIIEDKLRFHHWRYLISLVLFLFFLFCLNYALIQASTKCDSKLWAYETLKDAGRAFCEIVCLIYFAFFTILLFVEFFTTWSLVFGKKIGQRYADLINMSYLNGKQYNFLSITSDLITSQYRILDLKLKFLLSAFLVYFNSKYIIIDLIALESFGLLVILRISGSPAQWSFAGLTYIFFSVSLLKHTRIVPKLGAYVNDILQVFYKDIPSFSIVLIIIMLAFSGGIHLAARQQSLFAPLQQNQSIDRLTNLPYPVCNGSETAFFWFNPSLTALYDLRRPLLAGLVLFLDRGIGTHEEDLLQDNFIFTLIYLAFAYLITILMLNILIAQFVNSYRRIANVNSYDYKFELLVGLELRSFIFFGKFFRKSSSIESIEMPLGVWDQIQREATTRPLLDKAIMDLNSEFIRRGTEIDQEFDKNSKSHDNLRSKVTELSREVNSRLVEFEKSIDSMNNSKECLNQINELKGGLLEIKEMLKLKLN